MALYGANPYGLSTPTPMYANPANIPQPLNPQPYQQPTVSQSTQNGSNVVWVQGEAGAKSYLVAAGNSIILMDSESPVFYIKSADQSGMPILRKFKFEEITNEQVITQQVPQQINLDNYVTWDALNKRLEELLSVKEEKKNE